MLVSGVQQRESVIHIYASFFRFFSHLGYYRILSRVLFSVSLVVFYFKYSNVYMSIPSGVSHLGHHVSLSISYLKSLILHAYMLKSMSYLSLVLESGRWVIFPFFCILIFWNKAKFKNSILRIIQTSSRKFSMDFSAIPQSLLNPE